MKAFVFAALAGFHALASAAPTLAERHVRHERRELDEHYAAWVKRDAVAADLVLPLRIGLVQRNLHRAHDLLMEVADPESPKYGQHYTVEQVHELFAPSDDSVDAVRQWLEAAGIHTDRISQSVNKQWIQLDLATEDAESLLKTKFHVYEHADSGKTSIGCDEYHVHEDAQPHIDYITPGVRMLGLKPEAAQLAKRGAYTHRLPIHKTPLKVPIELVTKQQTSGSTKYCTELITPDCITSFYNISAPRTTAIKGNELGIFEDLAEYLDQDDMDLYFTNVAPRIPNGTFPTVRNIDGAMSYRYQPNVSGEEAALDFQIAYPLIYPQETVLWNVDDPVYQANYTETGFFNNFLDAIDGSYCTYSAFGIKGNSAIDPKYPDPAAGGYKGKLQCGVYKSTNVVSFSYSGAEFKEGLPANYMRRQCNEYLKLGLQGITVVFSSGDDGVGSSAGCGGSRGQYFNPNFPVNCPYVLGVGATVLIEVNNTVTEIATTAFGSGGGFSNHFVRPSYQDAAVEGYFASPEAPTYPYYTNSSYDGGRYNRSGRGIPDVSSLGENIVVFWKGDPYTAAGTSASAPTWAALITRINEERLAAGKKTVGFINPTLYKNTEVFKDITQGNNPACVTTGFNTAPGWDPVTGLGSPRYPELLKLFMSLP